MKRVAIILMTTLSLAMVIASPPGGFRKPLPRANKEAEEKLKAAYAAYVQGHYRRAIKLALEVYQKYGDVEARWFPSWVTKVVKTSLPDPYHRGEVLSKTISGSFLFTMAIKNTFPSHLLARSYLACGEHEEVWRWTENLRKLGWEHDGITRVLTFPHPFGVGEIKDVPKETWRPLPLPFLEEDYFILVPLDQACKVLGLSCSITPNPKMAGGKGIRIVKPDAPNIVYRLFLGQPLVERLEGGKGQTETIAYAPYEEDGVVWVPFYWLAKQAGIKGWEVRDGKIYVAPKQGTK
jgi:hypothetical protein